MRAACRLGRHSLHNIGARLNSQNHPGGSAITAVGAANAAVFVGHAPRVSPRRTARAEDQVFGRKSQVSGLVDGYVVKVIAAINATRRDTFPRTSFVPGVAP
jgi:hypothetical protein